MSRIATLLLFAAAPDKTAPLTAEQAMAAHRGRTSIAREGCAGAAADEIVVCARRADPYALPLYDPMDDDDASRSGGNRVGQMAAINESDSACARQSVACLPPPAVDVFTVLGIVAKGVIKGAEALLDDE